MPNALNSAGTISAQWVSSSSKIRMRTKIGMIVTYCGHHQLRQEDEEEHVPPGERGAGRRRTPPSST